MPLCFVSDNSFALGGKGLNFHLNTLTASFSVFFQTGAQGLRGFF